MISFLRWWALICSMAAGLFLLNENGLFFSYLVSVDHSRLTFVNLGIFSIATVFVGWLHKKLLVDADQAQVRFLKPCWFASDALMAVGMVGTLVGFMMMFSTNMAHLDVSNIESVKGVVVQLTKGFSTSVVTTLVGISLSTLLKLQLVNLELGMEK
jgi:hypothetical protein